MSANSLKSATKKVVINNMTFDVPSSYVCPITRHVMVQPLKTRSGLHFERDAILSWLKVVGTCPLTLTPLQVSDLTPNMHLQHQIHTWRKANGLPLNGNSKDFRPFENDIISYFLSLSSEEEVGILERICSQKIVSSVDNKAVRNNGGNNKDFKPFEDDIISCFQALSSKEEVGILGHIGSPKIVSSVDNKGVLNNGVRNNGARWSILRRNMYYAPLA
jgi:hypothetical protein